MQTFVDGHSHVTPFSFPAAPHDESAPRWPCMRCETGGDRTLMIGKAPFRRLDPRSWEVARRIEDMDRDGVSMQILSPMPELLSYWLPVDEAQALCAASNHQIAEMIAAAPRRFRGLGAVPLQDMEVAITTLRSLRRDFGLSGVEIGSNIDGKMLGDPYFDPFWAAAESEGMAVFVHALHPIAAKPLPSDPKFTATVLFPVDVAMAAASMIVADVSGRFPKLRVGFSHGGGALGAILGRLDRVWRQTGSPGRSPSEQARNFFFDSNVYDADYLRFLATGSLRGRIFAGTDYPYDIMQMSPVDFVAGMKLDIEAGASLCAGAASAFLAEDLVAAGQPLGGERAQHI